MHCICLHKRADLRERRLVAACSQAFLQLARQVWGLKMLGLCGLQNEARQELALCFSTCRDATVNIHKAKDFIYLP